MVYMTDIKIILLLLVLLPGKLQAFLPADDTMNCHSGIWFPDLGNDYYQNPIIHADYSDPDVIRVGNGFYMTASSFNCVPGLPILHSNDLVNWKIVNHALSELIPYDTFSVPRHGCGVWAPSIRFHDGEFYIFWGDPDYGIYMTKTKDPVGEWSEPFLIKAGRGWIDPCPLWDDDDHAPDGLGQAYLVHAWAGSRSGLKSMLMVHRMSADGTRLLDDGVMVFDGHMDNRTVEGPKFYKKDGFYYIFAPAGGVTEGWQLVLRSENVLGPYESKVVLHQGNTEINGPHQGAWIITPLGNENWFIHFQDKGAYGRVVHLQPIQWKDGWPLIGIDRDDDGIGEPVSQYKKPAVIGVNPVCIPQGSDEFDEPFPGRQWQWHANPSPGSGFPSGRMGYYRLNALTIPESNKNLWEVPDLFLQKFTAEEFTATTRIEFYPHQTGDKTGLIIMGMDYAYIGLEKRDDGLHIQQVVCEDAGAGSSEDCIESRLIEGNVLYLRVVVRKDARCRFFYSLDNVGFYPLGTAFTAQPGKWIGAKIGYFCTGSIRSNDSGYVNIDWFRITH